MIVIPAVDIRRGKCVRLVQGRAERETIFGDNPLQIAVDWEKRGARRLHVVDLDGAFEGTPQNGSLIESILLHVRVPVQVGGGVRSPATVERYLNAGAARVVLGTIAYHNYGLVQELATAFPERIVVGIDARDGRVAVDGWVRRMDLSAVELAREYEGVPLAGFVYTDVARDGMLAGPNLPAIRAFCEAAPAPVVASGGIASVEHLRALAGLGLPNLEGVIVGTAFYSGALSFEDALRAAEE